jgi:hypothetical protein
MLGRGLFLAAVLGLIGWAITAEILADYELDKTMGSYWCLSVKSSDLNTKAEYLNRFVAAVEDAHLSGYNAIWLQTPDNSIAQNMVALHSLQSRMNEIKSMDVTSFAYQQAISQITAQEQGEADKLLGTIRGVWYLQQHPLLWDWYDLLKWLVLGGRWAAVSLL